jgi:hypothetical protein
MQALAAGLRIDFAVSGKERLYRQKKIDLSPSTKAPFTRANFISQISFDQMHLIKS